MQFFDHPVKTIRLDNVSELSSQKFLDYCISVGIDVEHPIAHAHTQNGLVESLIKCLQLIARSLLLRTKLSLSALGHAILHAVTLIWIRSTTNHECSYLQLVLCSQANVSHLHILVVLFMFP